MTLIEFITNNWTDILTLLSYVVAGASLLIKIIPNLDKKHKLKPILQFVGKYLALNRSK